MSVGCAIPVVLEALGVDTVFGIPGNHTAELYRGLSDTNIRHITTRHEQGASFMADGYARVNRRPGVCFLISGPGLLNAATGIVQAQQDCIPMLVITTYSESASKNIALHEMPDQASVAEGLCKSVYTVAEADQVQETLVAAYRKCLAPSPGAVIFQVHTSLLDAAIQVKKVLPDKVQAKRSIRGVAGLASALSQAESPLLLLGGGAQDVAELVQLAERIDAPVLNTVNGKGVVPRSHPLAVGGSPSLACLKRALAEVDVVLALGTQFSETDFDLLMNEPLKFVARIFYVDTGHVNPFENSNTVHIKAPVEDVLRRLLPRLKQLDKGGAKRASKLRAAVRNEPHYHQAFARIFAAIQDCADDFVLVGDSTRPTYYASWMYECEHPGRYFHSVSGLWHFRLRHPCCIWRAVGRQNPGDWSDW